ncbi:hypothetical protein [Natronosalvus amylolyticus]|uniref:hypothetical protein n=1 Tax=Natronosalvus amylolyticus TaxID=2961994 RepID=UPI0020C9FD19|nr:hypothetical protein [Natronosalvus amylolyticus]
MGVTHQQPDAISGIEKTVDLTQYPLELPDTARAAQVTITGDASRFRIDVVRKNKWVVEGDLNSTHVMGVYHESQPLDLPATVPRWLELVLCDLDIGIDEVSI